MARVAGVNIPTDMRIEISLTYVYGIGRSLSNQILKEAKIDIDKRAKDLSEEELNRIRDGVKKFQVEGDLRRYIAGNISRLKYINCYRGIRHDKKLPVRGQRTKTNARTRKGRKQTIANKKKETK